MTGGRMLGPRLRSAREAKRWDLARAERETRIRARYLAALEEGDYRDLPSPVYTRGFVHSYAQHLGLDPDRCVELYRAEAGVAEAPAPRLAPPTPVAARRGGTIITGGRLVGGGLIVGVTAFVAYLAYQFVTFAGTPQLTVTQPATDLVAHDGVTYVFRGQTEPNARVEVTGGRENPTVTADGEGRFTVQVSLVPGSNVITLVATDPRTGRSSDPVRRTITVTLATPTPVPSATPGPATPSPSSP